MSEEPSRPGSWWTTLPGILSGIAAIVTAAAALVAALVQTGLFAASREAKPPTRRFETLAVPSLEPAAADAPMRAGPFEVRLTEHWWQTGAPGEARLHLRWQVTNQGPKATTFDPGRYLRLVLPDGDRPPSSNRPNFETVQPKEVLFGESEFAPAGPADSVVIAVPAMEDKARQQRQLRP